MPYELIFFSQWTYNILRLLDTLYDIYNFKTEMLQNSWLCINCIINGSSKRILKYFINEMFFLVFLWILWSYLHRFYETMVRWPMLYYCSGDEHVCGSSYGSTESKVLVMNCRHLYISRFRRSAHRLWIYVP